MATAKVSMVSYPRLPTEIIFLIIDCVPVDHILPIRTLSRAVLHHIDNHILCSYLRRTTLFAWTLSPDAGEFKDLAARDAMCLSRLTATFSHIEDGPAVTAKERKALWTGRYAIFRLDASWLETFHRTKDALPHCKYPSHLLQELFSYGPSAVDVPMSWCMQLDDAALDYDVEVTYPEAHLDELDYDLYAWILRVEWRVMLFTFLRRQAEVSRRMRKVRITFVPDCRKEAKIYQQQNNASFTFGFEEDCIRSVRRDQFRYLLEMRGDDVERSTAQEIESLLPLFGRPRTIGPLNRRHDRVQRIENEAMRKIMTLRHGGNGLGFQLKFWEP
jgi:hypothetical protein